jgi:replicative DNA helicase
MAISRAVAPKIPPYAVASEKALLGALVRDLALVPLAQTRLSDGNLFFRLVYGRLFDALIDVHARRGACERPDLLEELETRGVADDARALLVDDTTAGDAAVATQNAEVIAEKARLRALMDLCTAIIHDAYYTERPCVDLVQDARRRLGELR